MSTKKTIANERKSYRLQTWNYSKEAVYFVTICTKDKEHYFGHVENGNMMLSNAGVIANVLWNEIKNHANNVKLDAFVVMPNHVHGIIIMGSGCGDNALVWTDNASIISDNACIVPTGDTRYQNMGKNSISSIIGSYKSAVTKHANRLGYPNGWQPRFHDHIIRNDESFKNIRNYIINNPANWNSDRFYDG